MGILDLEPGEPLKGAILRIILPDLKKGLDEDRTWKDHKNQDQRKLF